MCEYLICADHSSVDVILIFIQVSHLREAVRFHQYLIGQFECGANRLEVERHRQQMCGIQCRMLAKGIETYVVGKPNRVRDPRRPHPDIRGSRKFRHRHSETPTLKK